MKEITDRDQMLADIRQKCIEANPSIAQRTCSNLSCADRTIRLADVLLAINSNNIVVKDTGAILMRDPETWLFGWEKPHPIWNLRTDDLTQQSDETVAFIHSLLCV